MPLSPQQIEELIAKQLPGFTIVNEPAADAPGLFARPEANSPDFSAIQAKLGKKSPELSEPLPANDVITVQVRSPDNPTKPSAGSQLKYVFISNKTGEIVAIQG